MPVLPGTAARPRLEEARAFLAGAGPGGAVMLKALAGGGGRGMRPVTRRQDLAEAFERCRLGGAGGVRRRRRSTSSSCCPRARHIEVQIVGDGTGAVVHLWDRECSLQRQRQKLVEIAPALGLRRALRAAAAATRP